jgi:archaellin
MNMNFKKWCENNYVKIKKWEWYKNNSQTILNLLLIIGIIWTLLSGMFSFVPSLLYQKDSKISSTTKAGSVAIGENLNIVAIDGVDNPTSATLTALNISLQATPGSSSIDLSKVLVNIQGQTYNYGVFGSSATGNVFQVYVLRLANPNSPSLGNLNRYSTLPNPSIGPGDEARLDLNVTSLDMGQNTPITISLTPQSGATVTNPVTIPAFKGPSVSIYP